MSKRWFSERRRDHYHIIAKKEGYRSRSAYKLLEIAGKYKFIQKGDFVIDLGASPGGWMQVARNFVGEEGFILGIDLKKIEEFSYLNVESFIADISDTDDLVRKIIEKKPKKADVIISDIAPNVSGIWEVDHARQIDLARASFKIVKKILRLNGTFFLKVFHGDLLKDLIKELKEDFKFVKITKPKASKPSSSEFYILCSSYKGNRMTY